MITKGTDRERERDSYLSDFGRKGVRAPSVHLRKSLEEVMLRVWVPRTFQVSLSGTFLQIHIHIPQSSKLYPGRKKKTEEKKKRKKKKEEKKKRIPSGLKRFGLYLCWCKQSGWLQKLCYKHNCHLRSSEKLSVC